jgi:arabinose-5-phosphate isomerase
MKNTSQIPNPVAPLIDIREVGRAVLQTQSEALARIADQLTESFDEAVSAVVMTHQEQRRIITSGMGKAGHIAQKFSATLASTGISSFFVSPSEALHGDLGRFSSEDLAIIFSFSGESQEVIALIPRVKERSCRIIGITQAVDSSLGKASDIVVPLGSISECAPLNIAPTTSTTVMLAISDAIAMACCALRGFDRGHFARLHPAGDIGRRLVKVSEIMRSGEMHCVVNENLSVKEVIGHYIKTPGRPGAASVVNRIGKLVGVFTDGDLRRLLGNGVDFLDASVGSVIGRKPKTIAASASAREALEEMGKWRVDQLVVVDRNDNPIGMVDIQDLAGFLQGTAPRGTD